MRAFWKPWLAMLFAGVGTPACGSDEQPPVLVAGSEDPDADNDSGEDSSDDTSDIATDDTSEDGDDSDDAQDAGDQNAGDQNTGNQDDGSDSNEDDELDAVSASRPSRLSEHAAAYVPEAEGMLVFGGNRGIPLECSLPPANLVDEAWLLRDTPGEEAWERIEGDVPSPRSRHMMAASGDKAWVFGGRYRETPEQGAYTLYNDLWEFDAETLSFSSVSVSGVRPSARINGGLCYDSNRNELWLYGGNDAASGANYSPLDDVWRFRIDDGEWQEVEASSDDSPGARLFHSAICDTERDRLVVFGGATDVAFTDLLGLAEVWALDLEELAWEKLADAEGPPDSPDGRFWQGIVWDRADDVYLLFGGHDDTALGNRNDLWAFDPSDDSWVVLRDGDELNGEPNAVCDFPPDFTLVDADSPERRNAHAFVWSTSTDSALTFAGKTDCGVTDDVWRLEGGEWSNLLVARQGEVCARVMGDVAQCDNLCL